MEKSGRDTIRILHRLRPVGVAMAGADTFTPSRTDGHLVMASARRKQLRAAHLAKNPPSERITYRTCPITKKRGYRHEADALVIALHAAKTAPQRTYRCEFCGDWHLTRQPKRAAA